MAKKRSYKYTDEDLLWSPKTEELKVCGAVHPNYPGITCISTTACKSDCHVALLDGELVYFGKDAEVQMAAMAKSSIKRKFIPIKD